MTGEQLKTRISALVIGTFLSITSMGIMAPAAHAADSPDTGSVSPIAVAMVAVPHAAKPGTATPNIVIPGDCGTAFLYPGNGRDHVHYDFGFKNLSIHPIYVNGHVGAQNIDNGEADVNSFSGPSFSNTWEKQGNLWTGTGENLVTAYIHATGVFYDCESSPGLTQDVYVH